MENENELAEDLTLALMYLTKFKMDKIQELFSAWKGYDFDIINSLDEKELIIQGKYKNKSVLITEEGMKKAEEILKKIKH